MIGAVSTPKEKATVAHLEEVTSVLIGKHARIVVKGYNVDGIDNFSVSIHPIDLHEPNNYDASEDGIVLCKGVCDFEAISRKIVELLAEDG